VFSWVFSFVLVEILTHKTSFPEKSLQKLFFSGGIVIGVSKNVLFVAGSKKDNIVRLESGWDDDSAGSINWFG